MKLNNEVNPDTAAVSESTKVGSVAPVTGEYSGTAVLAIVWVGSDAGVPVGPSVAMGVGIGVLVGP